MGRKRHGKRREKPRIFHKEEPGYAPLFRKLAMMCGEPRIMRHAYVPYDDKVPLYWPKWVLPNHPSGDYVEAMFKRPGRGNRTTYHIIRYGKIRWVYFKATTKERREELRRVYIRAVAPDDDWLFEEDEAAKLRMSRRMFPQKK